MKQTIVFIRTSVQSPGDRTYFRLEPKRKQITYHDDDEINEIYALKEYRKQIQHLFTILKHICKSNEHLLSRPDLTLSVIKNYHNCINSSYHNCHSNTKSLLEIDNVDENDAILIFSGEQHDLPLLTNIINVFYGFQKMNIKFHIINLTNQSIPFEIALDSQNSLNDVFAGKNKTICDIEQEYHEFTNSNSELNKEKIHIDDVVFLNSNNILDECVAFHTSNNTLCNSDIVNTIKCMLYSKKYTLSKDFKDKKVNLHDISFEYKILTKPEDITREEILNFVFNIHNSSLI